MKGVIHKDRLVYFVFLSGLLMFTVFACINPYVRDSDNFFSVRHFSLVYVGVFLCLFGFLLELLFSKSLIVTKGTAAVFSIQFYTVFTSFYLNYDGLSENGGEHVLKLFVSCALSFCGFYLGAIHPKHNEVVGRTFFVVVYFFVFVGTLEVLEIGLYFTSRPFSTNLIFPMLLILALFFSSLSKVEKISITLVLGVLTAISLSRAQIFIFFGTFVVALYKSIGLVRSVVVIVFLVIISWLAILDFSSEEGFLYLSRIWSFDTSGRSELWDAALNTSGDWWDLLFGTGVYPLHNEISNGEIIATYHNLYLQSLKSLGLIGFAILLNFLFVLVRGPLNVPAALVLILLIAGVTYDLYFVVSYVGRYYEYPFFYFIIGLFLNRKQRILA